MPAWKAVAKFARMATCRLRIFAAPVHLDVFKALVLDWLVGHVEEKYVQVVFADGLRSWTFGHRLWGLEARGQHHSGGEAG